MRALLPALRRVRPSLQITLFGTEHSLGRDDFPTRMVESGIELREIQWTVERPWHSRPVSTRLAYRLGRLLGTEPADARSYVHKRFSAEISGHDVTYFPWPYRMAAPETQGALAVTLHDLNFMYFFGSPNMSFADSKLAESQFRDWVSRAEVVTSGEFMAGEIRRFFPEAQRLTVVPLSDLRGWVARDEDADEAFRQLGITRPFILCPTQTSVHKNVGVLIAAMAALRSTHQDLQLILTGRGTEQATGAATAIGSVRAADREDIRGLGYVSNLELDGLIRHAAAVVNPSLYEAGNGSGLDAWAHGTPVAMSNIPSFTEQLNTFGVMAAVFNPRDPADIAAKIRDIVDDASTWRSRTTESRAGMARRTWDTVAGEYLEVFDRAVSAGRQVAERDAVRRSAQ